MERVYDLGDFELLSGAVLPSAKLSYEVHGELNEARDNVIVYPTWASGRHADNRPSIGEGLALDPTMYCIVVPDMFCNGLSTSPSNAEPPLDGPRFPLVTPYDNVIAQHRLLTEHMGVGRVQLVVGFSMSAQQAFHWGALFPDFVDRIAPICGSAKTSPHNWAYLAGLQAVFECAEGWDGGECPTWPPGLHRALVRVMLMMAFSQDLFREGKHLTFGGGSFASTEAFFQAMEQAFLADWAPIDFYKQLATWMAADIGAHPKFGGDLDAALGAIRARALVMPCDTDTYFRVADNELEVAKMPNAELRVIRSPWGHVAGGSLGDPADVAFVHDGLKELLASPGGV
jgi:homoserine O-acetyltransferase